MDRELFTRWQSNKPPFSEGVLFCDQLLPIDDLRLVLRSTVQRLKTFFPIAELLALDDWHRHDGFVTIGRATTWDEIDQILLSDEHFYAARHGDAHVHRSFYPAGAHFLFRFDVLEMDEDPNHPGIWGTFDISAPAPLILAILEDLPPRLKTRLRNDNSKQYFDRTFGG